jgi:glycosyltransferase involved in cell wall biosynthesis
LAALLKVSDIAASLAFCHRLARWIRQQQIELIHTNSLKADLLGGIAGRLARVPVIWHVRDRISNDYLPSKVVRAFRLASRVLPSVIVANSAATLQTLRPNHKSKAPCHRWRVVHDGTPFLPLPTPVLTDANAPLVVGIVGRISPWKGQHIFLQAAALARHAFPNVRFRIIGAPLFSESEYEQSLHALGHELGLTDVIDFAGFREDVSNAISELDVLVHASTIGEPFGQVVIEAMMLGRPVIATRGGGVPEIVADGKTGLLVPMDDVHAMAGALKSLLSDPQLRANMGRAGRQRVLEHFRIETVAANISTLYDELLSA